MVGGRGACFSRGSWNEDPIFFSEVLFVHPTKNTEKNRQTQTNGIYFKKCFGMLVGCWLASLEEGTLSEMKTWAQDYPAPTVGLFGRLGCNASYSVHECCFEL